MTNINQGYQGAGRMPVNQGYAQHENWSTGICDCCDNFPRCCLTCWCPCITFGQVANIIDKGSSSCGAAGTVYGMLYVFTLCQCFYTCMYRTKIREQYNIPGDQVGDFCTHLWCERCALSQMYRELSSRGFHVSLGWQGNMAMHNRGVYSAPTAPSGMAR